MADWVLLDCVEDSATLTVYREVQPKPRLAPAPCPLATSVDTLVRKAGFKKIVISNRPVRNRPGLSSGGRTSDRVVTHE